MLHINSVLFSLAVVQIIMAAVLLTFWATHSKTNGLREMAAATTVGGVGALLAGIGATALNYHLIFVGPVCFVAGALLAARSMRRLQDRPPRRWLEAAALLVAVAAGYHFIIVGHKLAGAFVVNSAIFAVVCGLAARDLLGESDPAIRRGCQILGTIFAGFAAFNLVRAFVRPLMAEGPDLFGQIVLLDHFTVFFGMAVTIGWSLGLLWTAYGRAEFQLRAVNRELERFSGAVAHDLKVPLNAVIGYLEAVSLPSPSDDPAQTARFVSSAHQAALQMNRFIHDLLEHARSNQSERPMETADPAACLDAARQHLRSRIEASAAEIDVGPLLPVAANALQVTRVFQNLLDNALKYRADDEAPKIVIWSARTGNFAQIYLQDNGIGIDPEDQPKIFERFERARPSETVQGSGVGLAECRRIVETYGGSIDVVSAPGAGSTFRFSLPAAAG